MRFFSFSPVASMEPSHVRIQVVTSEGECSTLSSIAPRVCYAFSHCS